ncbi:choline trimethylamine-lyase [Providencia rettgeri]|uniref:choline trimethylamine-lyase n=1 Tax=Providencia rettgeri TaxID=587 RepID=UPI00288285B5|nr:choline trimethylamine-lyase [Providencia rettgeri]ELM3936810.1 choline trimethylamine-lyase [Providencia rettgeri]EMA4644092.1 choline trimethylamine-lyase [Providencia rettgeri]MDK3108830.1 choline trimethylamine-lyase [Providencia rettgeri]WRR96655.1 choline trimethylamine-lyase [Providencia rettgeri]
MNKYALTPRVKMLAERLSARNSSIITERANILEALGNQLSGAPQAIKPAQRFYEFIRHFPAFIAQDELIIGSQSSTPRGAIFHTENEINSHSIYTFLAGDSTIDAPDYLAVLNIGFLAIKAQLENKVRNIGSAVSRNSIDEANNCRSAIYACDAAIHFAQALASKAESMAAAESNQYRRAELQESAAILRNVPAKPAQTFKEACQAFYLLQLILHLENGSYAVNPMGFDKAVYPFYQRDIEQGHLTQAQAYEIVESLWLKLAELSEVRSTKQVDGYPMFDALKDGIYLNDPRVCLNELSAMMLSAHENISAINNGLKVRLYCGKNSVQPQYAAPNASYVAPAAQAETEFKVMEGLTPRLQRLRNRYLEARPSVSIYRALAFTEVVKNNPGLPPILLRAKAFRRACETAPILIQPEELIVGHPCGKARAGAFSPDIAWRWVVEELDTMSTRPQDPFVISEEDKKVIREEIAPFWEGRSLDEICEAQYREAGVWEFSGETFVSDLSYHQINGGGDTCPGYDVLLFTKGMNGIKADAQAKLAELSMENPDDIDRIYFYKASIETCEGVIAYSHRIAAHARELAVLESDQKRREELLTIAQVNENVPANPPVTLQEALQSIWTVESLFEIEENQTGLSLGRLDQYCLPMYENDIKTGRLTQDQALEMMQAFIIKCAELMWMSSELGAKYFAGYQPFINLTVGGQKRSGGDACNDLTYLIMDAVRFVKVYQPSLACRIHNQSPQKYMEKIVDVVKAGMGFPACHFDDSHIKMMLRKGFDFEDARDYCLMGCVEPQKSGRIYQWTSTGYTQWPIAIEFVLNRGRMVLFDSYQGLDTGDLRELKTFEDFDNAVKAQIAHIVRLSAIGTVISQRVHRDVAPKPLMSLLVEGCMEKGKDVAAGGAMINHGPGLIFSGLATYVDSIVAIRKLVYEDGRYTLEQIRDGLLANFEGYDELRRDCLNAPKFGNDDDYVDQYALDITEWTERECRKYDMLYSTLSHGTLSISNNTPIGELTAASANGRLAWMPLSDGISPTQGADKQGPTAIIKSISKMNVETMNIGMVHNFKFLKGLLDTPEGRHGLITLLRTASILGNGQMQFSYVDNEMLKKAQQEPEKYRDLIVRVAGYSAYFVELCKEVQDEIISRTVIEKF